MIFFFPWSLFFSPSLWFAAGTHVLERSIVYGYGLQVQNNPASLYRRLV